jgi:hypothetical protein
MGRDAKRTDDMKSGSEKSSPEKVSPSVIEDDDEDGDIATPKRDRDYPEDEAP